MSVDSRLLFDFVHRVSGANRLLITSRAENEASEPGTTLFVASTATPDRAMDVVSQNWKLAGFRQNPVILNNHNYLQVVGHAIEAKVPKTGDDAGKLMIRVKWDLDSPDPAVRNVGHQHITGVRRAGSVGFQSKKKTRRDKLPPDHEHYQAPIEVETWWGTEMVAGTLYESPELLEFSSATIPMNGEALQRSMRTILRADPPADAPADDAPTFDLAWIEDADARGQVLDALWPDLLDRVRGMIEPDPPADAPADEEVVQQALRVVWPSFLDRCRTDKGLRRILVAALDAAPPPPAPEPDLAGLILRQLES